MLYTKQIVSHGVCVMITLYFLNISLMGPRLTVLGNTNTQDSEATTKPVEETLTPKEIYQKMFRHKRAAHLEAVATIVKLGDYEKQHKMITLLLERLFKVLTDSQVKLMSAGFVPGDPFPSDETVRDAFSNVIENTAFFGNIILRLPDIVHDIMKRKRDWDITIQWSVGFCNISDVLEPKEKDLLNLMSQELGIIEADENYINPYKEEHKQRSKKLKDDLAEHARQELKKQQRKQRKEKRKGPRLSGSRSEL